MSGPVDRIAEEMREADDVGERRAQLVGHVVHEIDLELVGRLQRFVALAQRALDVDGVGDVLERHQRGAVGQRHGGAIDHVAVAPLEPADDRLAIVDRGDGRPQPLPERVVAVQRLGTSRSPPRYAAARRAPRAKAATCARRPDCTAAAARRCRTPRPPRRDCRASRPARGSARRSGARDRAAR